MIGVVSPAKALDFDSPPPVDPVGEPRLLADAARLATLMAARAPDEIAAMMSLSDSLAELTASRFGSWSLDHAPPAGRAALAAFAGDTYRGLRAPERFGPRDYRHAQRSLRILSGLYGVLRPLDPILPYRLEMGTRLPTDAGADLYAFWRSAVTDLLREDLAASPGPRALVNLASAEYFGAVDVERLGARVVTPTFLDRTARGELRVVAVHAKRARGAMAGWMVLERVTTLRALTDFSDLGYRFDAERSTPDAPVFVREGVGSSEGTN